MHITKRNLAIFLAATFIPAGILAGIAVGGVMKLVNPDDIDVTQGLAYLSYGVIPVFVTIILFISLAIALSFSLRHQDGNFRSARLPLTLLLVNILLSMGILLFREINGIAEDNWSRAHGQPTRQEKSQQLDKFFKTLKEKENSTN